MAENVAHTAQMRVAAEGDDTPLAMVDQALDTMIASAQIIEDNLGKIQTDGVPQKASLDAAQDAFENGVMPYLTDMAKAMEMFGE